MITTLTQWKVTYIQENKPNTILYISENFYQNVLRRVADISLDRELTNSVLEIKIEKVDPNTQFTQS